MRSHFKAREFVTPDPHKLWEVMPPEFTIEFDDGASFVTTAKKTFVSAFCWAFFLKYPETPLLAKHHLQTTLKGKPLNSSTINELLETIQRDAVYHYNLVLPLEKEDVLKLLWSINNRIYNEVTPYTEEDVTTLDLVDFLDIVDHPEIVRAIAAVPSTVHSKDPIIKETYDRCLEVIKTDPSLKDNNLCRMVEAKLVNNNQIVQCVVFRGFGTEVDGAIFLEPIMSNFVNGMTRLFDLTAESCSARKALLFAEAPLEDAEYFSRRLQLLTTTIERFVYQDCGTTRYADWYVHDAVYDSNGTMTYAGDLKYLIGKNYLDRDTKQLRQIDGSEKHLINSTIKMRSVLFCDATSQHTCCSVCFGGLAHNVSRFANLGHLCAATMTQQTTQSVLSTKHLDASSKSEDISLTSEQNTFFVLDQNKNGLLFKSDYAKKKLKFEINRDQAAGLADVMAFDNFDVLSFERIANIQVIDVRYFDGVGEVAHPLKISTDKRKAVFSEPFLRYLKKHPWETNDKGNFVFDMKDWNFKLPVIFYPEVEYSYSDHSQQIARMIESSVENMTDRVKPNSPAITLQELFMKVNDKLNMNIAPLELIVAAIMVPGPGSYDLGRGDPNAVLGIAQMLIKNRALSNAYAFKEQVTTLTSAKSFFPEGRPDSPMDVFFAPREVIAELDRQGM